MPPPGRKGALPPSRRTAGQEGAAGGPPAQAPRRVEQLTARESEILVLMADGLFNREISRRLWLTEETVKTHVHHVLTKLGARSRAHAVAIGMRTGLID